MNLSNSLNSRTPYVKTRSKLISLSVNNAEIFLLVTTTLVFFTITQSWQCWHYCQLCVAIYLQFSSLFATNDTSNCEVRNQGIHEDYISRLHASLAQLIFNGRAKTKLAMLAFFYCGEFVKNSSACIN